MSSMNFLHYDSNNNYNVTLALQQGGAERNSHRPL